MLLNNNVSIQATDPPFSPFRPAAAVASAKSEPSGLSIGTRLGRGDEQQLHETQVRYDFKLQ
jgi:hypothetical protein